MARDAQLERQARRDEWIARLRVFGEIALSVGVGLGLMGLALHLTDPGVAGVLWIAGQTVWLGGCLFALLGAYRRHLRDNP